MDNLSNAKNIKNLCKKYNFNFSHSLGQNFIINPIVCPKMAELSGADKNTGVIEIGPGAGVLTKELAKIAKKVLAIEIDKKLIPILEETLCNLDNVEILNGDILALDLNKIIKEKFDGEEIIICANLPYYITTPVIMKLLEEKIRIKNITVMVQKEVADRLCAGAANKNASAVGIAVNYYAEPQFLFNVNKNSFIPAPKVDSAVIKLNIKKEQNLALLSEKLFFKLVKAAFSQRRKTILNSISSGTNISKESLALVLKSCSIPKKFRAENLSIEQFAEITNRLIENKLAQ